MCIRDRQNPDHQGMAGQGRNGQEPHIRCRAQRRTQGRSEICLLYTSDAADERSSVDLGGRRIIKKKTITEIG